MTARMYELAQRLAEATDTSVSATMETALVSEAAKHGLEPLSHKEAVAALGETRRDKQQRTDSAVAAKIASGVFTF